MGIVIENFGKGHASCLSIDVEHECITVKKIPASKAARFMELFGDYQGEWKDNELDTSCAVGKEVLE